MAQKIIDSMGEPMVLGDGLQVTVSTSVGVAYCAPGRAPFGVTELLAHADKALYVAKRAGRNTYRFAQEAA